MRARCYAPFGTNVHRPYSAGELSFMYRSLVRESCSQFDSLPLTYLTPTRTHARAQAVRGRAAHPRGAGEARHCAELGGGQGAPSPRSCRVLRACHDRTRRDAPSPRRRHWLGERGDSGPRAPCDHARFMTHLRAGSFTVATECCTLGTYSLLQWAAGEYCSSNGSGERDYYKNSYRCRTNKQTTARA
jgi:hypothetical protein